MKVGSLFSGIGGFDLGLEKAGMEVAWQVEKDKDCLKVLNRHYPDSEKFEDVQEVGKHNLAPVDLICGGFPCQDLSVAGKREGLAGSRSGLWFEFHRILRELRPKWVLVENVPGLLSSNAGRDFAIILSGLGELGYFTAWRVLDSQWFGVAQRRRRVFLVGHLGDGRAAQVLFESACGCGHPPARREAGERVARNLETSPMDTGWDYQRLRIHDAKGIAPTMSQSDAKGGQRTPLISMTLNTKGGSGRIDGESETFVVGSHKGYAPASCPTNKDQALPLDATRIQGVMQVQWASGGGEVLNPTAQALRSGAEHNYQFVAFAQNTRDEVRLQGDGDISGALAAEPGMKQTTYVAFDTTQLTSPKNWSRPKPGDPCHPLASTAHIPKVANAMMVRRLTPTECERLQGFPDGWTEGLSDSARYRCLGNAVTFNVAEWIGRRLIHLDSTGKDAIFY